MLDLVALFLGAVVVVPAGLFISSAVIDAKRTRLLAQYKEAFDRGDAEAARRIRTLVRAGSSDGALTRESDKVGRGEMCLLNEKWAEARDFLAQVDRSLIPRKAQPGVLSNLAYATAQAGEPERAIALVRQALAEAEAQGAEYPAEKWPYLRGTHGVALGLAGHHDDAVAWLEPLIAIERPPRARSTRAYYLGQSYRALGRFAEAAKAYAVAAKADGPFADRARAALRSLHPHRG
jgi:tetratricopeptide (TPR) repeat protein